MLTDVSEIRSAYIIIALMMNSSTSQKILSFILAAVRTWEISRIPY
jgi:hypothetical protein